MSRFNVKQTVTVEVSIEVEAANADEAEGIVNDKLCMNATLVDVEESNFEVHEDGILDAETESVSAA